MNNISVANAVLNSIKKVSKSFRCFSKASITIWLMSLKSISR